MQNAGNAEVRKFGATLNSDHGDATRRAALAGQSLGLTPPTGLSTRHKTKYERLSKLRGEAFDNAFIDEMIDDHKQDIAKYEQQAKQASDATSTYAKETLPRLKEHLQIAQQLGSRTRSSTSTEGSRGSEVRRE